jgi:uncharacterized protein (DUF1800 family)
MPDHRDIALMAHLMRRAGFGATHDELDLLVAQGYEETLAQLLAPETQPDIDEALFFRYHPMAEYMHVSEHARTNWLFRMTNTKRPLQEKMVLFWHHVFATGVDKVESGHAMHTQISMFREHGMGNYRDLLVRLAQDPGMIYWLDNQDNHKRAPNENWGRELLELFSLGVGQYTEKDVYECARAFTGWTFVGKSRGIQLGQIPWQFEYRAEDHDETDKTFLGRTGNFGGEDIIDIVVRQPACARFIMRHLYSFFVEDEPEVPKWPNEPPKNPEAIDLLCQVFTDSDFEMEPVLRTLFSSDFFKEAEYKKVKNPAEVVVGALKLSGSFTGPDPSWGNLSTRPATMGQDILNPPSVEGWHTGGEWINSGALINRVNFVADHLRDTSNPGVDAMVRRIGNNGGSLTAAMFVERCLNELGLGTVDDETFQELVAQAELGGPIMYGTNGEFDKFSQRVGDMLALIAGTKEYQFG